MDIKVIIKDTTLDAQNITTEIEYTEEKTKNIEGTVLKTQSSIITSG